MTCCSDYLSQLACNLIIITDYSHQSNEVDNLLSHIPPIIQIWSSQKGNLRYTKTTSAPNMDRHGPRTDVSHDSTI